MSLGLAAFAAVLILIYNVSPERFRWWIILAGNGLFYTFPGREASVIVLMATVLPCFFLTKRKRE